MSRLRCEAPQTRRTTRWVFLLMFAVALFVGAAGLGTSAQGFPITYSVDGKQYIAVMAGLGGGSPRNAPGAIAPEIKIPQAGQALYVYALDDQK